MTFVVDNADEIFKIAVLEKIEVLSEPTDTIADKDMYY